MEPTEPDRSAPSVEEFESLRRENRELRARLDRIESQREAKKELKKKGLRISWGVLVPLLDRQRVVRSFGELSNQVIRLADPTDQPEKREVAESAKEFLSCCVRFAIRRRLFFMIVGLLAAAVPAIQLWLVMQQNQIIEKQNEFFEIQLYDQVAESMSEQAGEEKRKITGLLLANADPTFLYSVVLEVFDPSVGHVLQADNLRAPNLEAIRYRGPLLRSLARGLVLQRADREHEQIYEQARPGLEMVYRDAAERVRRLLRWNRFNLEAKVDDDAHYYLAQLGHVLRVHSRLARSVGKLDEFYADSAPLFVELVRLRTGTSPLDKTLTFALEDFLVDLGHAPEFGESNPSVGDKDLEVLKAEGLKQLKSGLQKLNVDVAPLGAFVGASTP